MPSYILRNINTGVILRTGSAPIEVVDIQAGPNEVADINIDGVSDLTHYYDNTAQEYKLKTEVPYTIDKTLIKSDGVDFVTISGLPNGLRVEFPGNNSDQYDGVSGDWPDGQSIEWGVTVPGVYEMDIITDLHLLTTITITATTTGT